jgi:SnoaL-like domain
VSSTEQSPLTDAGFVPAEQDTADLLAWFAEYDALAARGDVEAMADTALFPITVITNDSDGNGVTQVWDRAAFVQAMTAAMEGELADLKMENRRRPTFLNRDIAVVVTDSTVTAGGRIQHLRYADVMVKSEGSWRFTSMIQAGWGDMLKQFT